MTTTKGHPAGGEPRSEHDEHKPRRVSWQRASLGQRRRRIGIVLVLPAIVILLLVLLAPSAQTLLFSTQDVPESGVGPSPFVGFDNYVRVLTSGVFWHSVIITLIFSVCFVILSTSIGLVEGLLLSREFVGRALARSLLIIPWATPWLVVGILWRWFLDVDVGALNGALTRLGLIDVPIPFLAEQVWAVFFAIVAATWRQSSLSGLLILAALMTVSRDLHEAAQVDGAGAWRRFTHVTLPSIRPILIGVIALNSIYAFLQFDVIYMMTQGGPGDATMLLSILLFRQLFVFTSFGTGSAIAVLLSILAVIFAGVMAATQLRKAAKESGT